MHRLGVARSERVYHAFHCQSALNNVFKDYYCSARDVLVDAYNLLDFPVDIVP